MPLNILRGLFRGATRRVMTGKMGNKNFYKGRGVRNPGFHTRRAGYIIAQRKVPQFIIPDLTGFEGKRVTFLTNQTYLDLNEDRHKRTRFTLKPYVSMKAPKTTSPELTAEDLLKNIKENIHLIKYREIP